LASNAKKKTTFAKLNRENALRERRLRKEARRDARKQAAAAGPEPELSSGEIAPDSDLPGDVNPDAAPPSTTA
jgi:lysozyme family protein